MEHNFGGCVVFIWDIFNYFLTADQIFIFREKGFLCTISDEYVQNCSIFFFFLGGEGGATNYDNNIYDTGVVY